MQTIPRKIWLDASGKQLIQWPIPEIESLRSKPVSLPHQVIKGGSLVPISGITAAQVIIYCIIQFQLLNEDNYYTA